MDPEQLIPNGSSLIENATELGAVQQTCRAREFEPPGHVEKSTVVGCGQTLAAFGPTSVDNGAAGGSGHASAKAVAANPLDAAGLECAFHDVEATLQYGLGSC